MATRRRVRCWFGMSVACCCNAVATLLESLGFKVLNYAVLRGTEPAEVQRCFDVNVAAPLRLAQLWAQGRVEQKLGGSVVNVSSQLL